MKIDTLLMSIGVAVGVLLMCQGVLFDRLATNITATRATGVQCVSNYGSMIKKLKTYEEVYNE